MDSSTLNHIIFGCRGRKAKDPGASCITSLCILDVCEYSHTKYGIHELVLLILRNMCKYRHKSDAQMNIT